MSTISENTTVGEIAKKYFGGSVDHVIEIFNRAAQSVHHHWYDSGLEAGGAALTLIDKGEVCKAFDELKVAVLCYGKSLTGNDSCTIVSPTTINAIYEQIDLNSEDGRVVADYIAQIVKLNINDDNAENIVCIRELIHNLHILKEFVQKHHNGYVF